MEEYLRLFKGLAKYNNTSFKNGYNGNMDIQAMEVIAEKVRKQITALSTNKTKASRLFYNIHSKYSGQGKSDNIAGVDDVFEAELKELLNIALQESVKNIQQISSDVYAKVLGQELGNIPQYAVKKVMNESSSLIAKTSKAGIFINKPEYRSAKVDVRGFGGDVLIQGEIKPEWQDFIKTFTNAKFTVKNYKSNSKNNTTIHLGNTDARKAIIASLINLQVSQDDAVHIYYHSLNTRERLFKGHVYHLRFAYELTGAGLVDEENNKLEAADFFIYNDPVTDNVFVRSTKDMIANMMKYTPTSKGNPYKSNIVVVKTAF